MRALRLLISLAALLAPGGARAAPPLLQHHVTPNGLEVIVSESHAVPLVTIELAVKNGAYTEPPEYNGLSHLYEHMFFKSNAVIPNQETYLERARELGIIWDGTTNVERVNYFFTTTRAHLDEAMVFMRDAAVSPLFDAAELDRERQVVTGELDRNESSPQYHLWLEVGKRVWWKYPSRKQPIGDRQTVLTATREKMLTIQKRYYIPNNSLLIVTGDVNAGEVFARADTLYRPWQKGQDPFVKLPMVKHPPIPKTEVVVVEKPVETFSGMMVWHGPSTLAKDEDMSYPADVVSMALAEPSSPFQKALVESGACVGASLRWSTMKNTGPIELGFESEPAKADACLGAILAELPKLREPGYLPDDALANAAHRLEVATVIDREKPSEFAHMISYAWCSTGVDYYLHYAEKVKKVTHADITRFFDRYVLGKPYVLGVLVSPGMVKELGLDRAHFEQRIGVKGAAAKGAKR